MITCLLRIHGSRKDLCYTSVECVGSHQLVLHLVPHCTSAHCSQQSCLNGVFRLPESCRLRSEGELLLMVTRRGAI